MLLSRFFRHKFFLAVLILVFLVYTKSGSAEDLNAKRLVEKEFGLDAVIVTIFSVDNVGFQLLDVPRKIEGDDILNYWDRTHQLMMINGGYFEADFSPTGYYKLQGRLSSKKRPANLSGFVAFDDAGKILLLTAKDSLDKYPTVLQSGPYVIDPGGAIGIKSRSGKKAKRTLIGLTEDHSLVIVVSKPILLYDLARAIKKKMPSIERLLNLDGGPSTALKTAAYQILNEWPVRNYIVKVR